MDGWTHTVTNNTKILTPSACRERDNFHNFLSLWLTVYSIAYTNVWTIMWGVCMHLHHEYITWCFLAVQIVTFHPSILVYMPAWTDKGTTLRHIIIISPLNASALVTFRAFSTFAPSMIPRSAAVYRCRASSCKNDHILQSRKYWWTRVQRSHPSRRESQIALAVPTSQMSSLIRRYCLTYGLLIENAHHF